MPDAKIDLNLSVCAKTALGSLEIQSRALGLLPMARRLLILIDGKRSGKELALKGVEIFKGGKARYFEFLLSFSTTYRITF